MRSTVQRQKVSSALRNMTQIYSHQLIQATNLKQDKVSSMSFVNIESAKDDDKRKTLQKLNTNQFSTFVMPHTKQQTKILKSLMLQSRKKSLRAQQSSAKAKSERVRRIHPKHSNNEFSHRMKGDTALLKRMQEQTNQKMSQMKNKRNNLDLNQLQNLKKISEHNLIENIQNFIKQEQSSSDNQLNLIQVISQNQRTRTQQGPFPESTFQLIQNYNRWKRQEVASKFKQTVKNKLSRRHIHRVLKQKSEIINKIRAKTQHFSSSRQILQATGFSQSENVKPLHYGLTKSSLKHFYLNTLKHSSLPFFQNQQQLKIEAKAAEISSHIRIGMKQQQFLSRIQIGHIEGKSYNNLNRQTETNPESSNNFQLRKQSMSQNNKKMMIKRWKSTKDKYNSQQSYMSQGSNIFRQLTPWHGDYPE